MSSLVPLALFAWIPIVAALFGLLPARRALIVTYVAGWLLLPEASYRIEGPLPDYGKITATCLVPLLTVALFDRRRLASLRPTWIDAPMIVWCLCPFASSLSNGLGVYDGAAAVVSHIILWGVPYALGRAYLADSTGLYELAVGVFAGGILYAPLCLLESFFGPMLHWLVYGFHGAEMQRPRFSGWRPVVFMKSGLMVATWMMTASLTGAWLSVTRTQPRLAGISSGWWVALLIGTTVLARSANAWLLLLLGSTVLWSLRSPRVPRRWLPIWLPLVAVLLLPAAYVSARATTLWTGRALISVVALVDSDRAHSIKYRIESEEPLVAKARKRFWFGWGKWGNAEIDAPHGQYGTVRDSLWIIAFGDHGCVGLVSIMTVLLLPTIALWFRHPLAHWSQPAVAPAAVLALIVVLYAIDSCFNAMPNPIYGLAAGGVAGFAGSAGDSPAI